MGPRWNARLPHRCKIVYDKYNTFDDNYQRAWELFREMYWEAKRAPSYNHTMVVNPYRRQKLIQKFYGKTAAERKEKRALLNKAQKQFEIDHATAVQQRELDEADTKAKLSKKRRDYATLRKKLGFKDKGAEEVDDPVMDDLQIDKAIYEKALQERTDRKPIPQNVPVEGISKTEYYDSLLRDSERYQTR